MTTLLHGENTVASRNRLSQIREDFGGEVAEIDAKTALPENIAQAFSKGSLFSDRKLVVVESASELKDIKLTKSDLQGLDIVLWEDKKLTPAKIQNLEKLFSKLQTEEFKIDAVVFRFLEAIKPNAQKIFLPLWQQYVKNEPLEVAFTMLTRQFRFLLLSKISADAGPDDFKNLAPWQKSRLKNQADFYSREQLKNLLKKLLEIDYETKSGRNPNSLQTSLELFLLSL